MVQVTNSFTASTKIQSAQVNTNFTQVANAILPTFVFTVVGTLVVATSVTPILIVPANLTILKAYAAIKTAPTGASILINIMKNGTSIWNVTPANRLTIAAAALSGNQTVFDTTQLSDGDLLTLNIDQIGSSVGGVDLTVELRCEWR